MSATLFSGAQVLLPDGLRSVALRIEAGLITGIDVPADGALVQDATGFILAPAIIDIHGDAFERQIMPRPGVTLPLDAALLETDRQLAANGIATAYHALTLGWEPGLRSVEMGWQIFDALQRLAPRLSVENRLQLRWETFCHEAIPLIETALRARATPALAFNDHTTTALLHPSVALQDKPFDFDPAFPVVDLNSPAFAAKIEQRAKRSHLTAAQFIDLIRDIWQRRPQVQGWIAHLAEEGRKAGAPMLSHDDTQAVTRQYYRSLGATVSEFPLNRATALAARAGGDPIVLGAPNAARGGSHLGSVSAGQMIREGLCDILASDYYYPALLAAIDRLVTDGVGPLHSLWPLIAANPARALGLLDRGEIAAGKRADLVRNDLPAGHAPVVRQTWVAGRLAYQAQPMI